MLASTAETGGSTYTCSATENRFRVVCRNYPKSQAEYAKCPIGCRLHDVINSNAK